MKYLIGGLATLLLGAALSFAPAASAGPFCSFFDVAGLCDVRDAIKACSDYPSACEQYSPPPSQQPYGGYEQPSYGR
ncbi:MAG: hypothetical protein PGN37_16665 [Mycobacterium kyogaense]|uniref:hypothetical protein n=1 Tax=Mycobacterium kyogaense TaxID=2212479 RepID=UPI002FFCE305